MKTITLENYRTDKYYPRIVAAVTKILVQSNYVAPIQLFKEMGLLQDQDIENWRRGRIPYLEMVIKCNLSGTGRILRILRMHGHDLNLRPSITIYNRWGKGAKTRLQFSKSNTKNIEDAYSCHLLHVRGEKSKDTEDNIEADLISDSEKTPIL